MAVMIPAVLWATGAAAQGTASGGAAHHRHHHHHAGTAAAGAGAHRHHHGPTAHPVSASAHARHAKAPPHPYHGPAHRSAAVTRHAPAIATGVAAGVAAGAATGAAASAATANATALPASVPPAAPGAPDRDPDKGTVTSLPLPRFAALRADEVNMRSGPGQRYPIQWVYHRRNLPVKIEREFDVWRLVEDSDGQKGWVHQATLVGTRTFVVPGLPPVDPAQPVPASAAGTQPAAAPAGHSDTQIVGRLADPAAAATIPGAVMLRASADAASSIVAVLRPGAVGTFHDCAAGTGWCRVGVQHYSGWLDRRSVWGLLPQETIQPS
ncbi:SH3 domain-containing protein [Gluconacetobacter johannae]